MGTVKHFFKTIFSEEGGVPVTLKMIFLFVILPLD